MFDGMNSERHSKVFNRYFLITVLGVVAAALALNVAADPWRLLVPRDMNFSGGDLRGHNTTDRVLIPYRIRQTNFDVLFVGSSRVGALLTRRDGLQDEKLTAPLFGQSKVFIAAFSGPNIYILRRTIEHALALRALEEVYLLIDFVAMNDIRPNGAGWKDDRSKGGRFEESEFGLLANFMSVNMLKDSLQLVWESPRAGVSVTPIIPSGYDPGTRREDITRHWSDNIAEYFRSDLYGCHTIGETTIGHLETVLKKLSENGVRATLMTPVLHPAMMEMIWRTGNWRNYEAFLGLLARIGDSYAAQVWTFSPYAEIFSSDLFEMAHRKDAEFYETFGFNDASHVNFVVGREMLSHVRGVISHEMGTTTDFAFRLTPGSLASVLAGFRDDHRQYRQNHADAMSLVPVVRGNENGRCGKDYGYPAFDG